MIYIYHTIDVLLTNLNALHDYIIVHINLLMHKCRDMMYLYAV